jgi:hypothetical protein
MWALSIVVELHIAAAFMHLLYYGAGMMRRTLPRSRLLNEAYRASAARPIGLNVGRDSSQDANWPSRHHHPDQGENQQRRE